MITITPQQITVLLPSNRKAASWCDPLNTMLPKHGITTVPRVAAFISQCAHESTDFTALEENLNYSAETLLRVFPRYFGLGKADPARFARNPEALANYVYMDENRSAKGKLGNVIPGDGWKFRGRGLKQVTGRSNYTAFGRAFGMTPDEAVAYLGTKEGALASALWFWDTRNLNEIADVQDVIRMTMAINGGTIGLLDRKRRFALAMRVIGSDTLPSGRPTAPVVPKV